TPVKLIENMRQVFLRDPESVVFDTDLQPVFYIADGNGDRDALIRILNGILDQVLHDIRKVRQIRVYILPAGPYRTGDGYLFPIAVLVLLSQRMEKLLDSNRLFIQGQGFFGIVA